MDKTGKGTSLNKQPCTYPYDLTCTLTSVGPLGEGEVVEHTAMPDETVCRVANFTEGPIQALV